MMPNITLNVELFIKLMKLTTSQTDGEALAALRAANRTLNASGGDWENLLRGKLAPIDPFASLPTPEPQESAPRPAYQPPPPPSPPPPPRRNRGVDKKEAKLVITWLTKLEFSILDKTVQHQHNMIDKEWKTHKALTDVQYNWLRAAAASVGTGP